MRAAVLMCSSMVFHCATSSQPRNLIEHRNFPQPLSGNFVKPNGEAMEGQLFDRMAELVGGNEPNITETIHEAEKIYEGRLKDQAKSNLKFPIEAIKNAAINGEEYPTIYPRQAGPLPNWKLDVICNPSVFPQGCVSVGDYSRAIGIPLREFYWTSKVGKVQKRLGDALLRVESDATLGYTEPVNQLVWQSPAVEAAEEIALGASPVLLLDSEGPTIHFIDNITETLIFQPLELIDKTEEKRETIQFAKDKARSALQCRIFNGQLPHCKPSSAARKPSIPMHIPTDGTRDPTTGLYEYVYVMGVAFSCRVQGTCIIGTGEMQPGQFDGLYKLYGADAAGYPIYRKTAHFIDFTASTELFIMREDIPRSYRFPSGINAVISPTLAGITINDPSPFAYYEGRLNTSRCHPGDFPMCTSVNYTDDTTGSKDDQKLFTQWRLTRLSSGSCGGHRDGLTGLCLYPVAPLIFPSKPPTVSSISRNDLL